MAAVHTECLNPEALFATRNLIDKRPTPFYISSSFISFLEVKLNSSLIRECKFS